MSAPKFIEIRDRLLQDIRGGTYTPGALLPTRDELRVRFDTTRATVNKALAELARMGVVKGERRKGTVVLDASAERKVAIVGSGSTPPSGVGRAEPCDLMGIFNTMFLGGADVQFTFIDQPDALSSPSKLYEFNRVVWIQPSLAGMETAAKLGAKAIVTNRYGEPFGFVSTAHRDAQKEMTLRMLENADKKADVYYLDPSADSFVFRERREGFVDACEEMQRFYRVFHIKESIDEEIPLKEIATKGSKQIVIVAPSRCRTGGVLKMAREYKLQLGKELLYCDFDNLHAEEWYGMSIPTVLQDYETMGKEISQAIFGDDCVAVRKYIPHKIIGL